MLRWMTRKAIQYLAMIKDARWLRPSRSPEDEDCAVMEFDVEVPAELVASIGQLTMFLRTLDPSVDTDHPVFRYMGERQIAGENSRLTLTVSMRRTEGGARQYERVSTIRR